MSNPRNRIIAYILIAVYLLGILFTPKWMLRTVAYNIISILCVWIYLIWVTLQYGKDGKKAFKYLDFYTIGIYTILLSVWNLIATVFITDTSLAVRLCGKVETLLLYTMILSFVLFALRAVLFLSHTIKAEKPPAKQNASDQTQS